MRLRVAVKIERRVFASVYGRPVDPRPVRRTTFLRAMRRLLRRGDLW